MRLGGLVQGSRGGNSLLCGVAKFVALLSTHKAPDLPVLLHPKLSSDFQRPSMNTATFCYVNSGRDIERMMTLGTAVQDSGGDGSTRAQCRHNRTVSSGQEANPLVPCHLALSSQYCILHSRDTKALGQHGGVLGGLQLPILYLQPLALNPALMGWGEKWMPAHLP